jgi:hypothetical protein
LKIRDYRFKLVFNFSEDETLENHFLSLAAFEVLNLKKLEKLASENYSDLASLLKKAILNAS